MKKTLLMISLLIGSIGLVSAQSAVSPKPKHIQQNKAANQKAFNDRQIALKKSVAKQQTPVSGRIVKAPDALTPTQAKN